MAESQPRTPNVWVVRADGGEETQNCVNGGFTGIGWKEIGDLTDAADRSEITVRWLSAAADHDVVASVRTAIGNISRFLFDIQIGDWVITPEANRRWLRCGQVIGGYCYESNAADACQYHHRRDMMWHGDRIDRQALSEPFRKTLRSQLTVFQARHETEFFERIGFSIQRR